MAELLPSSTNRHIEANKIYTESLQKVKDIKNPMYLTIPEGNQGGPSSADITNRRFFAIEYFKHGK